MTFPLTSRLNPNTTATLTIKTFTVANVIQQVGKPTLILSHNKTLAHQLYTEMKAFFPHNAVEYYVSYYDYYQPEAYLPATDTYIEKDLAINEEVDRLRLAFRQERCHRGQFRFLYIWYGSTDGFR